MRRTYTSGKTEEALLVFGDLLNQCNDSSAVRLADVLAVLVTHHAHRSQWKQVRPSFTLSQFMLTICMSEKPGCSRKTESGNVVKWLMST